MRIEINPRSLLNLEHICEVLYKLHPSVLDVLIEIERSLGKVSGLIDLDNTSLEEREFLADNYEEKDYSSEPVSQDVKITTQFHNNIEDLRKVLDEYKSNNPNVKILTEESDSILLKTIAELKKDKNSKKFYNLRKYLQLDTNEYIPIKIYVEVEDPVIGKKFRNWLELLKKLELQNSFILIKEN